mgnify:CR=1 FL=1
MRTSYIGYLKKYNRLEGNPKKRNNSLFSEMRTSLMFLDLILIPTIPVNSLIILTSQAQPI